MGSSTLRHLCHTKSYCGFLQDYSSAIFVSVVQGGVEKHVKQDSRSVRQYSAVSFLALGKSFFLHPSALLLPPCCLMVRPAPMRDSQASASPTLTGTASPLKVLPQQHLQSPMSSRAHELVEPLGATGGKPLEPHPHLYLPQESVVLCSWFPSR